DAEFEFAPKIGAPERNCGSAIAGMRRFGGVSRVGLRQGDVNGDIHGAEFCFGVQLSLLRIVLSLAAGIFNKLCEGSGKSYGGNVRANFWRRQMLCVAGKEFAHGSVFTLAKKVGAARGLFRKMTLERATGRGKKKKGSEYSEKRLGQEAHSWAP